VKRAILLFALLFGAASAYGNPVTIALISFDGPFVNGIPTYPYTLALEPAIFFWGMCDDYYHDGAPGDHWLANLTNLENDSLTNVRFASAGLDAYQEAAWILIETYVTDPSQWPDMNFAVWHIFNPTVPITAQAQYWIDQAVLYHSYLDYSEVYIATPVNIDAPPSGDQEFLFLRNGGGRIPPTPEPGALALLATGAFGTFAAARRKWMR
jgi:PEP-CTERM motif